MRIIDTHLHTDRMKGKEVETISIAGVEGGVIPTAHLLPWLVSAETLRRMWRNYLNFHLTYPALHYFLQELLQLSPHCLVPETLNGDGKTLRKAFQRTQKTWYNEIKEVP